MAENYEDIINLPHHISKKHRPMPREARAAQFAPFAALTGYESDVNEAARYTGKRRELGEYETERLNRRINEIRDGIHGNTEVIITYFKPDEKKAGGEYLNIGGRVRKIDDYGRTLTLTSGALIPLDDISEIVFKDGKASE
jgi:yolD-like protein